MTNHLIAALVAVVPAAAALWLGRHLDRIIDAGSLAERLAANRARNSGVTAACVTIVCISTSSDWPWALGLLFVTRMSAGYVIRRRLYGDTWTIVGYISFFTRLTVAAFGFWILLSLMPWLASRAGTWDWLAGSVLALVLIVINHTYALTFRRVLRARPVDDPVIVAQFREMVGQCALRHASLETVDLGGGTFVNAVALPSTRWPAILTTSALLERLDADETVAVLGHELAHLEHYTPRRVQVLNSVNYALILAGALLSPVARMLLPQAFWALMCLWQLVLFVVMVLRAKDRQAHETASDVRAVALSGNADALARALVKIHAAGRIARRWDVELERQSTHPSLARRIQAIHAAAGTAPAMLGECAAFTGADGSSVIFHDDRLVWNEGSTSSHTIPYQRLTMVRVDARSAKTPRLVALDEAHRRWQLALNPADIARAQATLDIVDVRLGTPAAPPAVSLLLPRLVAITAITTSFSLHPWPTALIAAVAAMLPATPIVAAAGAASVGTAALTLRANTAWATDWQPWMASVLLAAGVVFLAVSVANRRERPPRQANVIVWLLGAGALASWAVAAVSTDNVVDLHRAFLGWPSATVFALALGAALAGVATRAARYASVVAVAAGLTAFTVGSAVFLDRFADDPFLARGQTLNVRTITGDPIAEFTVPFDVSQLSLSPDGRFVAVASEDDESEVTRIHAGAVGGGPFTDFDADAAYFVDDAMLLVFERERHGSVLRLVNLAQQARSVWSHRIDWPGGRMSFDPASKTWRVFGWSADENDIVSVGGMLGSDRITEARWKGPASRRNSFTEALGVSRSSLLALETTYAPRTWPRSRLGMLLGEIPTATSYRLWTLGASPSPLLDSHLDVDCPAVSRDDEGPLCTAYDGSRTGFFAIDATARRLTPLVTVPGRSSIYGDAGDGWLTGWWERAPMLIRPVRHEAIRVAPRTGERPYALAISETAIGAVTSGEDGATIRVYARE